MSIILPMVSFLCKSWLYCVAKRRKEKSFLLEFSEVFDRQVLFALFGLIAKKFGMKF